MLSFRLLGSPQILIHQQPLHVSRRKSRALLYYLANNPDPHPREHLLALLWPDLDRTSAQQTFRTTLYGLRKTLGTYLLATDDTLSLSGNTEVDSRTFLSNLQFTISSYLTPQLAVESLLKTLALYRGEFLEGFSLPDSVPFDDWQISQAEHFRRLTIRGRTTLSQLYEANQDYRAALDALDLALVFDPLQEDLQRAALRLHYLAGDRTGAIRRYDKLRSLLDKEMGVPPMAETRTLYDAIITDTLPIPEPTQTLARLTSRSPITNYQVPNYVSPSESPLPTPQYLLPFTGRAAELQSLRELASKSQLILFEGEPGIGKTRLVEEFLRSNKSYPTASVILTGIARELEQSLPYQPIIAALRSLLNYPAWLALREGLDLPPVWLEETARLLPELSATSVRWDIPPRPGTPGLPGPSAESRLWEGVSRFLSALARQQPVILFLDDVQWADESTLALLGYLVRNSTGIPLTFLATTRSPAPRSPLWLLIQTLTRDNRAVRLSLDRLSPADIAILAENLVRQNPAPLAEWLTHNSEGNPFVLVELIRYAREQGFLTSEALNTDILSTAPIVPQTVYSLIQSRLHRLSEESRRVLDVAVVVGRVFDFDVVQRASGLSESAALDALDELRTAGFVSPVEGWQFSIDHILTMEVAWREVGEVRHRMIHRRVAETLEKMHRHPDEIAGLLAFHYAEGYALPQAAPYAFRAGKQAARLAAWREAIGFYELALDGTTESQKFEIYMALGEVQESGGESLQASESYRTALTLSLKDLDRRDGDRTRLDRARLALGRSLLTQGRFQEVISLAQEVLTGKQPENEFPAEFQWGAALSIEGADLQSAVEHLHRAETLAHRAEDTSQMALVTFELGSIAAQQGDLPTAITRYRQALEMANEIEDETAFQWQALANNNLAYHLHLMGKRETARDHAQAGLHIAETRGLLPLLPYLYSTCGEIALAESNLDAAEENFKRGLELAQRLNNPERIAGLTANLGLVARQQKKIPLAIHRLSSALTRADTLGIHHLAAQIRIWLAPLLPPDEAHATLTEARAIAEQGGRRGLLEQITRLQAGK
jgi:DNA-binding SARP family transcriptional activator